MAMAVGLCEFDLWPSRLHLGNFHPLVQRGARKDLNYFACSAGLMFKQASVDVEYPSNLSWLFINPAGEKRENRGLEAGNM